MIATAEDLKRDSAKLIHSAEQGEEIIITVEGKPCAKLMPYSEPELTADNPLFGMWRDNDAVEHVDEYVESLRKGRC